MSTWLTWFRHLSSSVLIASASSSILFSYVYWLPSTWFSSSSCIFLTFRLNFLLLSSWPISVPMRCLIWVAWSFSCLDVPGSVSSPHDRDGSRESGGLRRSQHGLHDRVCAALQPVLIVGIVYGIFIFGILSECSSSLTNFTNLLSCSWPNGTFSSSPGFEKARDDKTALWLELVINGHTQWQQGSSIDEKSGPICLFLSHLKMLGAVEAVYESWASLPNCSGLYHGDFVYHLNVDYKH